MLDALSTWPAYRAGQLLFDLLELEDFMVDGEQPGVVATTLTPAALRRLADVLRALGRQLDGAPADIAALAPAAVQCLAGAVSAVKRQIDAALWGSQHAQASSRSPAATLPALQAGSYSPTSARAQDVSGWRLDVGDSGQSFACAPDTLLAPGRAVRVYTDEAHAESGGFAFGLARAICNDAGDTATLLDAQGTLVSQLAYGSQDPPPAP